MRSLGSMVAVERFHSHPVSTGWMFRNPTLETVSTVYRLTQSETVKTLENLQASTITRVQTGENESTTSTP